MNKIQLLSNHLSASSSSGNANESPILVESQGHYTDIVLNRPKKMNSVTPAMAQKFQALIREFNQNPNTKVVFLRKAGGPAFCAGGDLNAITESKKNGGSEFTYQHQINTVVHLMSQAKPTTIAFLDGIVMGTGVGLSYFAKIKIATENTLLAMPESKLGYFTDVGSGWFLPRLQNGVGLYMMMTGEGIRGEDLVRVGLAHYFVESKKLEELLRELKEFANKSKAEDVSEKALRSIVEKYRKPVEGKFSLEALAKEHFEGKKSAEEVFESLKAKAEQDPKVKKVLELLSKNSPLGVKINFELHRRGKTMTVKEILNLELGIEDAVSATGEILRGVQRVLLKKDVPWSNESISEVKESEINELFQVSTNARLLD